MVDKQSLDEIAERTEQIDLDKRRTLGFLKNLGIAAVGISAGAALLKATPAQAANGMYSDQQLEAMMAQPVETTLEGTGVVYVNDNNYQQEVFGANSPVMVLFYVDTKTGDGQPLSRGNATLTNVLSHMFPQIKFCAYEITQGTIEDGTRVSYEEAGRLKEKYGVKDTPAVLLFDNDSGKVEYDEQMAGGIKTLGGLKKNITIFREYIEKNILD